MRAASSWISLFSFVTGAVLTFLLDFLLALLDSSVAPTTPGAGVLLLDVFFLVGFALSSGSPSEAPSLLFFFLLLFFFSGFSERALTDTATAPGCTTPSSSSSDPFDVTARISSAESDTAGDAAALLGDGIGDVLPMVVSDGLYC